MNGVPDDDGLARSSTLVATGILLSRISGLVRESATGAFLGTGPAADAFRAALRIPNLLQNLLGEGVLSAAFIPVYSRALAEERDDDAGRLAGAVAAFILAVTTVVVVLAVTFAHPITRVLTPGFTPGTPRFELTVTLVRIVTPGVGFLVLSAWCLGILNSHRRFFLSYVAPVLWNAAIVAAVTAGALAGLTEIGLARSLAVGALIGSVLQFGVQLPTVRRLVGPLRLRPDLDAPGMRTVLRRFTEVVAGRGSIQIAGYLDLVVASLLAAGAFAAVGYAQVLYLLPISLFGMSVAAAELPTLSTMDHTDRRAVTTRLDAGMGRVAFFVLPTTAVFLFAGDRITATIYQGLRFTADDAAQVGLVLAVYALGLVAATSTRLLQSALYGVGDTRGPAVISAVRVAVGLAVALAVIFPLDAYQITADGIRRVADPTWGITEAAARTADSGMHRLGPAGLALGAAVGAWLEYGLLRRRVSATFGAVRLGGAHRARLVVAALGAAAAGLLARAAMTLVTVHPRLDGVVILIAAGVVYLAIARAWKIPEAVELTGRLARGVRR